MSRKVALLVAAPLVLLVLALGGTWLYVNVLSDDAPDRLSVSSGTSAPPAATGGAPTGGAPVAVDGTWNVTGGSVAGYRVAEVLFGQSTTAVGRTDKVTGSLAIAGRAVRTATFTVDMASVTSDRERRDGQYRGRIMDTGTYPTSTFALTEPIDLGGVPAEGAEVSAKATGDLTLRGTTRNVTFDVTAVRTGGQIKVSGSIHLVFDDWGIPSPSFGPATVEDEGELEFLLVLAR
jgi:polyisoprenoid-binding protein YceI